MAKLYVFPGNLNHREHLFPEINYNPPLTKTYLFVNNIELNIARIVFKPGVINVSDNVWL